MQTTRSQQILPWISAILLLLTISGPFLWAVVTSLKPEAMAVSYPPVFLPSSITFENYLSVLSTATFATDLWNSVIFN